MFCIYRISDGQAVSFGSVVADPLPDGLAAVDVGDITGKRWDPQTLAMVDAPPEPETRTPEQQLADVKAVLAEAATIDAPVLAEAVIDLLARAADAIGD